MQDKKGFTLVELIVVVTILSILATIGFISFQGYTKNSRDTVRISDMKNIGNGIMFFQTKSGILPMPEDYVTITASGSTIRYQGVAGSNVLRMIGLSNGGKDPVTKAYYLYTIDGYKSQYQIAGLLEALSSSFPEQAYADYLGSSLKTYGNDLGIIWDINTNKPINEALGGSGTLDIWNTTNTYKLILNDKHNETGTGKTLFTQIYNNDSRLLKEKNLAYIDDSLVGYWDMETTISSGSLVMLKDFSKYGNNGVCHDGSNVVNCGSGGPVMSNGNMIFDGTNDYIEINKNIYSDTMTILVKVKPLIFDSARHGIAGYQEPSTGLRPFNLRISPDFAVSGNGGFHYDAHDITATSLTEAGTDGKRCTDNVSYAYDPKAIEDVESYLAYRRNPPYIKLNVNNAVIFNRDCRKSNGIEYLHFQNFNYFWIGRIDNYFKGTIDEVRVYNRVLTDDEISALYGSTVTQKNIKY